MTKMMTRMMTRMTRDVGIHRRVNFNIFALSKSTFEVLWSSMVARHVFAVMSQFSRRLSGLAS